MDQHPGYAEFDPDERIADAFFEVATLPRTIMTLTLRQVLLALRLGDASELAGELDAVAWLEYRGIA